MTPVAQLRNAALCVIMLAVNVSAVVAQDGASPPTTRLSETATARIESDSVTVAVLALWLAYSRRRTVAHRIAAGIAAVLLMGWPLWAAAQTYLFVFSILPSLWPWLCGASALVGFRLACIALMPERSR